MAMEDVWDAAKYARDNLWTTIKVVSAPKLLQLDFYKHKTQQKIWFVHTLYIRDYCGLHYSPKRQNVENHLQNKTALPPRNWRHETALVQIVWYTSYSSV